MARFAPTQVAQVQAYSQTLTLGHQGAWSWLQADSLANEKSPVHDALKQAGWRLSVNKSAWLGVSVWCKADSLVTADELRTCLSMGKSARKPADVKPKDAPVNTPAKAPADKPKSTSKPKSTFVPAQAPTDTLVITRDELAQMVSRAVAIQVGELESRMTGYLVKALESYDVRAKKGARK